MKKRSRSQSEIDVEFTEGDEAIEARLARILKSQASRVATGETLRITFVLNFERVDGRRSGSEWKEQEGVIVVGEVSNLRYISVSANSLLKEFCRELEKDLEERGHGSKTRQ